MAWTADLHETLLQLPGLLVGLTVHEFAHAWSSSRLGDDFARRQGRVSLNPARHLTLVGTLALLLLHFGWGRPVPVNLYNYRRPRRDYLLSSLAGPAANVLLVGLGLGLLHLTKHTYSLGDRAAWWMWQAHSLLAGLVIINAILAVVNLIPIPPLDGSKIWPCLVPGRTASFTARSSPWMLIVVIVLFANGVLNPVFRTVISMLNRVMPPSQTQVLFRQAVLANAAGRYDRAEGLLDRVLLAEPESSEGLYVRATARAQQQKWQAALEDVNAAIRLDPQRADAYGLRACILAQSGRWDEVRLDLATYERLSGKDPQEVPWLRHGLETP